MEGDESDFDDKDGIDMLPNEIFRISWSGIIKCN